MMAHKRSRTAQDRRDIAWTRTARHAVHRDGTGSTWPVDHGTTEAGRSWVQVTPRSTDHESAGHYHWRTNHKNLSKRLRYSGPLKEL